MLKKYRIWLLLGLLGLMPVVYVGSYVLYRRTHLYECEYWERFPKSPRWAVHFEPSIAGYAVSLVYYPLSYVDMHTNDIAISRIDGRELERDGSQLYCRGRRSTASPKFRSVVATRIKENGEVLAVIGLPDDAGTSYEFFRSMKAFEQRLNALPPTTQIIVHAQRQLPVRGVVNAAFIDRALAEVPTGNEWAIVCEEEQGSVTYRGKTPLEFKAKLQELAGRSVAAGHEPHWFAGELVGDTQGIVPNADGTVTYADIQLRQPFEEFVPF